MKTFGSTKHLKEILAQCKAQGLLVDLDKYRSGSDYIVIRGGDAEVMFNTFNGRFHGTTPDGVQFSSDNANHEREPWFQALLSFFYNEKVARRVAPWLDFAGNILHEGDTISHPVGKERAVVTYDLEKEKIDKNFGWRAVYENGDSLWLGNQINDKGQAVVVNTEDSKA